MTDPERQARSRARSWRDAVAELTALQAEYAAWPDVLPTSVQDSATAQALQAICDMHQKAFGVDQGMPLLAADLLARIISFRINTGPLFPRSSRSGCQ